MSGPSDWSDEKLAGMKKIIEEEIVKRKPKAKPSKPSTQESGDKE